MNINVFTNQQNANYCEIDKVGEIGVPLLLMTMNEKIENDFLKVQRFMTGNAKKPSDELIIKNIIHCLDRMAAKKEELLRGYLCEIYDMYKQWSECYVSPSFLFDSSHMYTRTIRYIKSGIEKGNTTDGCPTDGERVPIPLLCKFGKAPSLSGQGDECGVDLSEELSNVMERLEFWYPSSITRSAGQVLEMGYLNLKYNGIRLEEHPANEFNREVSGENILLYKRIISLPEEKKREGIQFLKELMEKIRQLEERYSLKVKKPSFTALEFIRLDNCWTETSLSALYDILVGKGWLEAGKKESFVAFFIGFNDLRDIECIVWYGPSDSGNMPEIKYLLSGLKSMEHFGNYLKNHEEQAVTLEGMDEHLKNCTKEYSELSKMKIENLKDYQLGRRIDSLKHSIQELRDKRRRLSSKILRLPTFPTDLHHMLKLFVDENGKVLNSGKMRINKGEEYRAREVYDILQSALAHSER